MRAGGTEGGLGEGGGHPNRISPPLLTKSESHAHHPKGNTRSNLFINRCRKTVTLPRNVLTENRLNRDQGSRKQTVKKSKAKRTRKAGNDPIGKVALSGGRVCNGSDHQGGQTVEDTTRNDWTIQGNFPEEVCAPDWPQAHNRCLRGRPQSSPPHLSDLLPIASRVRNRRNGAVMAAAKTAAHQPSMGDDSPNSGEAEGRQGPGRGRGAPVAVGMVLAPPRVNETGSTPQNLGEKRSRWPTGNGPDVAHTSVPAGKNPSGRHNKEHEAYFYKASPRNFTPDKRKRLYSEFFGSLVRAPRSHAKYDDFMTSRLFWTRRFSVEPESMPVELLRNKCIVIFRMGLSQEALTWPLCSRTCSPRKTVPIFASSTRWGSGGTTL